MPTFNRISFQTHHETKSVVDSRHCAGDSLTRNRTTSLLSLGQGKVSIKITMRGSFLPVLTFRPHGITKQNKKHRAPA